MTDLIKLAERVEAAMGADRELDAYIHCVREGLTFVLLATGNEAYGDICDPSDSGYGTTNKCSPGKLYARFPDEKNPPTLGGGTRGNRVQGCTPPDYTANLDAAMTLVPAGHDWSVSSEQGRGVAYTVKRPSDFAPDIGAATPALALCAAALRARASMEREP